MVKNPPAMQETGVWSLGWEDFLEKGMAAPTPVFLSGESHGQRNLPGYSPWGRKESDTTERLSIHAEIKDKIEVFRKAVISLTVGDLLWVPGFLSGSSVLWGMYRPWNESQEHDLLVSKKWQHKQCVSLLDGINMPNTSILHALWPCPSKPRSLELRWWHNKMDQPGPRSDSDGQSPSDDQCRKCSMSGKENSKLWF